MSATALTSPECPQATAGDLAVLNLESSLDRAWHILRSWPDRPGIIKRIVSEEQQRGQFLGDATALDRLVQLSSELCETRPMSAETHLIAAQIASMRHHFADAKVHLAKAKALGATQVASDRLRLTLAQALGENLMEVVAARQEIAEATESLEDLVPLGAVLADLGEFEDADRTYLRAIQHYDGVSPFPLAWVCFQLGVLWGETIPTPDPDRAAHWYSRAIGYLPAYTHARVHLAEIHLEAEDLDAAEALLLPIVSSGDPEVRWRLSQVKASQGRTNEAERERDSACSTFEDLLARHELAFADHAAEFYLSSGSDPERACDLARINLANRPTLRAFVLAHAAASESSNQHFALEILARAREQWGHIKAFKLSPLADPDCPSSAADNTGAKS
jgi:tetratricopeptide (TPR) repeat protein